jgi:hypothetical protein
MAKATVKSVLMVKLLVFAITFEDKSIWKEE